MRCTDVPNIIIAKRKTLSQAARKYTTDHSIDNKWQRNLKEVLTISLFIVSTYLFIALISYDQNDPGWSYIIEVEKIENNAGRLGAWIADVVLYVFGYCGYCFPLLFLFSGWRFFSEWLRQQPFDIFRYLVHLVGLTISLVGATGLASLFFIAGTALPEVAVGAGGILGDLMSRVFFNISGDVGSSLIFIGSLLMGFSLYTDISWAQVADKTGQKALCILPTLRKFKQFIKDQKTGRLAKKDRGLSVKEVKLANEERSPVKIEPSISKLKVSDRLVKEKQTTLFKQPPKGVLPGLRLLDPPTKTTEQYSTEALAAISRQVELKLKDFNITVEVVAVHPGPVITRFELRPAPGLKVSQISNLAKDLARSLSVPSVRVVEIIPGTSVIGLEIPNEHRVLVSLGEILSSVEYENSTSSLSLVLGKDISGRPVVVDLTKMPHLLVAGTTGSGKSVALNAMILSLLYKATAEEIRLIMIDPKMLELSVYEGIPHLLAPVVTDMKEASNALRWAVFEMERRYRLMASLGVRNIAGYNRKIGESVAAQKPIEEPNYKGTAQTGAPKILETLPLIVVIVDELADMMMTVGKKVEELIARLAQKARAAGIHLVLATQRPSVDVITGLIKANIPSRIAFQVSSKVDSRTILDQIGAENLLGHGDMLYLPPGQGLPERVHGAFVSDEEVHKVVESLREQGGANYLDEIIKGPKDENNMAADFNQSDNMDELYDQAVRIVTETRKASISYIQRRLKIGYNRAARMIEEMEGAGIVSHLSSNGNRDVLAPPPPDL